MLEPGVTIRVARLADVPALAGIRAVIHPYRVQSLAAQQRAFEVVPQRAAARFVVAEENGSIIGCARAMRDVGSSEPGAATLAVDVLAEHRGRGVGRALLDDAEGHLRGIGAVTARLWCHDDEPSTGFAVRRGYELRRRMQFAMVDPRTLPPMPPVPPDVELIDLFEAGRDAVYEFDCVAALDEPGDAPAGIPPRDEWTTLHWENPDQRHELGVVAVVRGRVAAATFVEADLATGRSWSGFTGVLAEHRGRGLAKLIKSASLRRVAAAGITAAYTSNDAANAPMLAVNRSLGYRITASERSCRKAL